MQEFSNHKIQAHLAVGAAWMTGRTLNLSSEILEIFISCRQARAQNRQSVRAGISKRRLLKATFNLNTSKNCSTSQSPTTTQHRTVALVTGLLLNNWSISALGQTLCFAMLTQAKWRGCFAPGSFAWFTPPEKQRLGLSSSLAMQATHQVGYAPDLTWLGKRSGYFSRTTGMQGMQ